MFTQLPSLTSISHCRQLTQKRRTEYSGIPWILRGHPWNILPRDFPEACNTDVMCMTKLLCQLFDWANLRDQESKGCLKKETRWWHSLDTRPRCLQALRKEWSINQFLHFYWSKLWWDKRDGVLRTVLKNLWQFSAFSIVWFCQHFHSNKIGVVASVVVSFCLILCFIYLFFFLEPVSSQMFS